MEKSILQLFPQEQRPRWQKLEAEQDKLQEIRLRVGKPVLLYKEGKEFFLGETGDVIRDIKGAYQVTGRELERMLEHICHYSPYAFEEELRRGFLTVAGGHRIGIAGQVVLEADGSIRTIKNISYVNIRISHQLKGVADGILPRIYRKGELKNILIVSPPGCGKTTLLRDLVRRISDGNEYGEGMTVGLVDERSELAGSFLGQPQNDCGLRTDVLDGCPKESGMLLMLRSMNPRVIAIDELGSDGELRALRQAAACGCKILTTVHGKNFEDVIRRFGCGRELWESLFDLFLILGKEDGHCMILECFEREEKYG